LFYSGAFTIRPAMLPLLHTLKFITGHPFNRGHEMAALAGYLRWQIGSRLLPGGVICDWVDGSRMIVSRGETGLTGNLYCGLHEFGDMAYVLHVMGPDDLFVDIGANVGSYTILACAARGARGICIEPVPSTFERLQANLRLNNLGARVEAHNIGLADAEGELLFTASLNSVNHVVTPEEAQQDTVRVPMRTLDQVLAGRSPSMLKIDVEGFETRVLQGAPACLADPVLHTVIMELNGSGERYGFDETALLRLMRGHGFEPYFYEPYARQLQALEGESFPPGNLVFVRGRERVMEKIARAGQARILGRLL